jgi:membrane protease YdiL (CAAX protease family)
MRTIALIGLGSIVFTLVHQLGHETARAAVHGVAMVAFGIAYRATSAADGWS